MTTRCPTVCLVCGGAPPSVVRSPIYPTAHTHLCTACLGKHTQATLGVYPWCGGPLPYQQLQLL